MTNPREDILSLVVPAGWKLVPVEPTVEMKHAADMTANWRDIWPNMLAAAPTPPAAEAPVPVRDASLQFSEWINAGPALAKAAGCYVGITIGPHPKAARARQPSVPAPVVPDPDAAIDALADRLWRVHPREVQESGLTRAQWYAARMKELFAAPPTYADAEAKGFKRASWPNGSDNSVPAALRYLADHNRPQGGEQRFNSAHLYQLAAEIEDMAARPLFTAIRSLASPAPKEPGQ